MTNEERDRMMEFILQQQARFSVNMEQMQERQAELREAQTELREAQARTQQQIDRNSLQLEHMFGIVGSMLDHQHRLAARQEQMQATDEAMRLAHAATGERVNALINTVERMISERGGDGGKRTE